MTVLPCARLFCGKHRMALNSWPRRLKHLDTCSHTCMMRYDLSTLQHSAYAQNLEICLDGTLGQFWVAEEKFLFKVFPLWHVQTWVADPRSCQGIRSCLHTWILPVQKGNMFFNFWDELSWIFCNFWSKNVYKCTLILYYQTRWKSKGFEELRNKLQCTWQECCDYHSLIYETWRAFLDAVVTYLVFFVDMSVIICVGQLFWTTVVYFGWGVSISGFIEWWVPLLDRMGGGPLN